MDDASEDASRSISEYRRYIEDIDIIEDRVVDDTKYPVVANSKIKICCKYSLEILKVVINYVGLYIDAPKKEKQ